MEVEYVDAECYGPNGCEIRKIPAAWCPKFKMKDIIRNYYGSNFEDEESVENSMLGAMEDFHKWYLEQRKLLDNVSRDGY